MDIRLAWRTRMITRRNPPIRGKCCSYVCDVRMDPAYVPPVMSLLPPKPLE